MPRKPYASIVRERVSELQESEWVRIRGYEPSTEDLGDEFEHVFTHLVRDDSSIIRAFDACNLNISDPFNWVDLLTVFCDLHFPPKKVPSKRKRTLEFLHVLQRDRAEVRKKHGQLKKGAERVKLVAMFRSRYGQLKDSTLRRIISAEDRQQKKHRKRK